MPVQIASYLIPKNGNNFFLLEDTYFRGGLRVCETTSDRDAIPEESRKALMLVVTQDTGLIWQLDFDLVSWNEFKTGGGDSGPRSWFNKTVNEIEPSSYADFNAELGNTVLCLRLIVSKPCTVEVHSTADRIDTNPFKFVALEDHLEDDGSTYMTDGTSVRNRRFHIWSNLEDTPNGNVFFRVLNTSEDLLSVDVSVLYKPLES